MAKKLSRKWLLNYLAQYDARKSIWERLSGDSKEIKLLRNLLPNPPAKVDLDLDNSKIPSNSIALQPLIQAVVHLDDMELSPNIIFLINEVIKNSTLRFGITYDILSAIKLDIEERRIDLSFLKKLPNEILLRIFGYLKEHEMPAVAGTCKLFLTLASDRVLHKGMDYSRHTFRSVSFALKESGDVAFSPTAEIIVAAPSSGRQIDIFDIKGAKIRTLKKETTSIYTFLAFSCDKLLVASDNSGAIDVWDMETYQLRNSFTNIIGSGRSEPIQTLPDGNFIVEDGIFDINNGQKLKTFDITSRPNSISVTSDGTSIICGFGKKYIEIYSTETGKLSRRIDTDFPVYMAKIFGNKLFYSGFSNLLVILDLDKGTSKTITTNQYSQTPQISDFTISKNGKHIVIPEYSGFCATVWNFKSGELEQTIRCSEFSKRVFFSKGDNEIIVGGYYGIEIRTLESKNLEKAVLEKAKSRFHPTPL